MAYNILYSLNMECPYCSHPYSKVTNKRKSPKGIRRRRECLSKKCGKRFTTYERVELSEIYVVKKDGKRELFNNEKMNLGIKRAFEKRPVPKEKIDKMLNEIEEIIRKNGDEVKSSFIGDTIMKKIEKIDKVAYVRFASVYRDFSDIKDFKKELRGLK